MNNYKSILGLDLQLFGEGAGGGSGAGAGTGAGAGSGIGGTGTDGSSGVSAGVPSQQTKGVKNPLADVKYGIQDTVDVQIPTVQQNETISAEQLQAEFDELIKGKYKDPYSKKVQDTVQKRFKNSKEVESKYNALMPTLEMLGSKYGVDATDIEALNRAIQEDDSYYEDEALEKGITVEQLKEIKRMERENADLRRQMQEASMRENADKVYAGWMNEAEGLGQIYPSFDLQTELQDSKFMDLLKYGIDMRTAYEVIHKDEIIPAAMQFSAQQVEQKLVNKIMSNGARPVENGMNGSAPSLVKSDVSKLTKADRQEIIRRVAMGEKIRF